jgi:mercuric reductase
MSGTVRRVRMPVAGMGSERCEPRVREALERVGARHVNASWRQGEVWFGLPRSIDRAALRAAVSAAGYAPGEIERPLPT